MFYLFRKRTIETEQLEKIKNILFPTPKKYKEAGKNILIDHSVVLNLDAVIGDLENDINDANLRKTLNTILQKLEEVKKILRVENHLSKNIDYVVVDMDHKNQNFENIKMQENENF